LRALTIAVMSLAPVAVEAQSIGVFSDVGGFSTQVCVTPLLPSRAYVIAILGGVFGSGIQGAEFCVKGYDSTWTNVITPNREANFLTGDPVTTGCQIAFPACQSGSGGLTVLLYTIDTTALQSIPVTPLAVTKHDYPSNPNFGCPLLVMCDGPVWTKWCVSGWTSELIPCTTGVAATTWTAVRSMYR
jgi:hypothetical protein